MSDELQDIKAQLQALEEEIKGVIRAEGRLESLPEFPLFVNYIVNGEPKYSAGRGGVLTAQFNADLHLSRSVLPNDEAELEPYILLTIKKLAANVTLGGLCEHCLIKRFEIGGFDYGGGTRTYGIRFQIEIKVKIGGVTVATG